MTESNPVLAGFERPVAETETRIAILSDLHLSVEESGTWRVSHRTAERLEAAVKSLSRLRDLDGVIFVGDLVQSGLRSEYEAFDRIVDELDAPFFALPEITTARTPVRSSSSIRPITCVSLASPGSATSKRSPQWKKKSASVSSA